MGHLENVKVPSTHDRFHGLKFKRRQPIGRPVVDFVCLNHAE
ncbi:DUF559 domain-containing protein [Candidatus Thiosymbion oneisti]